MNQCILFLIFYTFVSGIFASNREVVFEKSVLSTHLTRDNYRQVFDLGEVKQVITVEFGGRRYRSEETTSKEADFVFDDEDKVVSGEFFHGYDLPGDDAVGAMSYISVDSQGQYVRTITKDHSTWEEDEEDHEEIEPSWWRKMVQKRRALSENVEFSIKWYYTAAAAEEAGGLDQLEAKILLAMADTNQAYANSGLAINAITSGDMIEWTATTITDNMWKTQFVQELSDEARQEADIIALVHAESEDDGCGQAYNIPEWYDAENNWWPGSAYFRVRTSCLTGYTPAHEVGHLMGLGHNSHTSHCPYPMTGCGNVIQCGNYWSASNGRRTVMSYTSSSMHNFNFSNPGTIQDGYPCSAEEAGIELRVGYFSAPDVEFILDGESFITGSDMANSVSKIQEAVQYISHYSQEGAHDEICDFEYVNEIVPFLKMAAVEDLIPCTPNCATEHQLYNQHSDAYEICGLSNGILNGWAVGTVVFQEENVDNGFTFSCYVMKSCEAATSSTTAPTLPTTSSTALSVSSTNTPPNDAPSVSPTTTSPSDAPSVSPTTTSPSDAPSVSPTTTSPSDAPSVSPTTTSPSDAPSVVSGLDLFNLVGNGWCRPACLSPSSCKVNGFRRDDSNIDECHSTCLATEGCVGFAISNADHSYPNRCYVHGLQGFVAPSGWTPYVKSHYEIHQSSGAQNVNCYNLDNPVTSGLISTGPAISTVPNTEVPTVPATQIPTGPAELEHFEFVGEGWCRPGCLSSSCKVNGMRKEFSTVSECASACTSNVGCVGFAISDASNAYPNRCYVYGQNGMDIPPGWTPYAKPYFVVENASGTSGVSCYKYLDVQDLTTTTHFPTNCPDIVSFDASSTTGIWAAENVANTASSTFWMSESNSGNAEWVSFEYSQAAVVTSVEIQIASGRQGSAPVFQGSNDASNWDDLVDITSVHECPMAPHNQRKCQFAVGSNQAYKFYRYHSNALAAYVLLNHVVPTCVVESNSIITRRLLRDFSQGSKNAEKMISRKN